MRATNCRATNCPAHTTLPTNDHCLSLSLSLALSLTLSLSRTHARTHTAERPSFKAGDDELNSSHGALQLLHLPHCFLELVRRRVRVEGVCRSGGVGGVTGGVHLWRRCLRVLRMSGRGMVGVGVGRGGVEESRRMRITTVRSVCLSIPHHPTRRVGRRRSAIWGRMHRSVVVAQL
jgi:hypothetical protein